jgi:hypothetical protein
VKCARVCEAADTCCPWLPQLEAVLQGVVGAETLFRAGAARPALAEEFSTFKLVDSFCSALSLLLGAGSSPELDRCWKLVESSRGRGKGGR